MDAKEAEQLCVEAVQIITRESTDEENRQNEYQQNQNLSTTLILSAAPVDIE